jgi:WD40 repeat protein
VVPNHYAVALSPDGKILATGEGGKVCFWEVATGKELRSVHLGYSVVAVVFSPDGKLFAGHTDDTDLSGPPWDEHSIQVGEVASGKVLHKLIDRRKHHGFKGVTFSPDGTMLAALRDADQHDESPKDVLVLWDVHTGKELRHFKGVLGMAFTPDGKRLVLGKEDGVIQVLDSATGRPLQRLEGHRAAVHVLAVSPDGRTLVSADTGKYNPPSDKEAGTHVRLWDLESGKVRHRWLGPEGFVIALLFSADGRAIAVGDTEGNLLLYDVTSEKQRQRFRGKPEEYRSGVAGKPYEARSFTFSPDGKVLLWHATDGTFRDWDLACGEGRRRWGRQDSVVRVAYSPDGKVLATRGEDGLVVWDVAAGKELHPFPGHRAPVRALAFSPDGRLVASLDESRVLGLWEAGTGKPLLPMPPQQSEAVLGFRFAADGTLFSAVGSDATVRVWTVTDGMKERRFRVGTEETVREWERLGFRLGREFLPDGSPSPCFVYSPGGKLLAVTGADQAIHLWDVAAGKELRSLRGHRGQVGRLLFSPDGRLLVSKGVDRTIRLWDVRTGQELGHFRGAENESASFRFSPDSKVLLWRWGDVLHQWDVAGREELHRFAGAGDQYLAAEFLRDGKALALTRHGAVHVWDLVAGQELRTLRMLAGQDSIDFALRLRRFPDGTLLAEPVYKPAWGEYLDVGAGRRLKALSWSSEIAVSPDGKTLIQADDALRVVDMLSGDLVGEIPGGHCGGVAALAFSADGKFLATGGWEGSILVWDWRAASGLAAAGTEKVDVRELERAWRDLGARSGKTACRAVGTLAVAGDEGAACLDRHVEAVTERQREAVRRLVGALDDHRSEERDRAGRELEQLGAEAEPMLRRALADRLSPEARRRVEALLSGPGIGRWSPQARQRIRAVQALEQIGTARARAVLTKLARGIPEARLTQDAAEALARLH